MKASELRIGNLISDFGDRIVTVKCINISEFNFIEVNENHSEYEIEDLKPIPLTE